MFHLNIGLRQQEAHWPFSQTYNIFQLCPSQLDKTLHVVSCLQVLGDNTDQLVDKLLAQIKPGIISATDGLSTTAADEIMAKLRDWLDGDDEEIGGGVKGAAGDAEGAAPAAEMEQLQVADEVRGVRLLGVQLSAVCLALQLL
jgi:hypothetical protein